ncbi:MAG: hypothetical protein AB7P03_11940 [Kofleriaceae bacterium]
MTDVVRGVLLGAFVAIAGSSCIVHRLSTPRLTGTCEGACAHYVACKAGDTAADTERCRVECPQVFSDPGSLMEFENLSCTAAVEYVDGVPNKTAGRR